MRLRLLAGYALGSAAAALAAGVGLAQPADSGTPPPATPPPQTTPPQTTPPQTAPPLEPLPETPPNLIYSGALNQISIAQQTPTQTVEEASINGTLVWVRVTPRYGRPYYLIPSDGGSTFIRRDSLDTGLKVPAWVIFSW